MEGIYFQYYYKISIGLPLVVRSLGRGGTSPGSLTSIVRPAAAWGMPHASLRGGEKKEERKREEGAKSDNTELGAGSRLYWLG